MYFGTRTDKVMSYRLLDQYVAAGGSFLDTANIYAWWVPGFKGQESEVLLGEWLRRNYRFGCNFRHLAAQPWLSIRN